MLAQVESLLPLLGVLRPNIFILSRPILCTDLNCEVFVLDVTLLDKLRAFSGEKDARSDLSPVVVNVVFHIGKNVRLRLWKL